MSSCCGITRTSATSSWCLDKIGNVTAALLQCRLGEREISRRERSRRVLTCVALEAGGEAEACV
jgi:hypothetical protein